MKEARVPGQQKKKKTNLGTKAHLVQTIQDPHDDLRKTQ